MDETNENEIYEGSVIGNYRVVAMLGQGGMGTVYEVEHQELGTHYALKTFTFDPNHEASGALKRKFLEEGRLLARLKHPNLTHVFDLGFEEKTQMPYFVMDLVTYEDGGTYTVEDIDLADIDEELVYKWFKQLASALDYIHGEGIVHRDIKPGNLLVDKDLNVILTDFGISRIFGAKIKSEVDATRTVVTKTGRGKLVLGTVQYIAPEVMRGNEATPQADAYSLGVMLLRWLTGFDYSDNPGAIALLSKKKYRWLSVIPQLLAPFGRRPENYTELLKHLKPPAPASKPAAKPTVEPKQPVKQLPEKKTGVFNGLIAAGIAGLLAVGGYFVWRQNEKDRSQQALQIAAIQKQMEENKAEAVRAAKEAEEKRIAEEKRVAKEKRIAEEKKAREAKLAKKRRFEESRTKIEKLDASTLTVRELPKVETAEPEPEKKPEFKVVAKLEDIQEEKDYGPIPDRKYVWGTAKSPRPVEFQLANGAKMDLVPLNAGVFYMSNLCGASKDCHKVAITRPFWMGKYNVTTEEMREFDEREVRDCAELENVLKDIEKKEKKRYPLSKKHTRKKAEEFCRFLTGKYRSQLPADYVFRLPTEAELEYAFDELRTGIKYNSKLDDETLPDKGRARSEFEGLLKRYPKLKDTCKWSHNGFADMPMPVFLGGRTGANANGIIDVRVCHNYVMDIIRLEKGSKIETAISYSEKEINPLRWVENVDVVTCRDGNVKSIVRALWWNGTRSVRDIADNSRFLLRIVVGPDLIKEEAWKKCRVEAKQEGVRVPKNEWPSPKRVKKSLSRPQEFRFKLTGRNEMVFCAIPSGRFEMENPSGQRKECHKVELTNPYWMSKYCVTIDQWREFAKYDCSDAVTIETEEKFGRRFPKNPIYRAFTRNQWLAYCNFLNGRYGAQLPKGYVFRLPTEAEYEWAFAGGDRKMLADRNPFDPSNQRCKSEFAEMWKKCGMPKNWEYQEQGQFYSRLFIGGRTEPTKFGVCDLCIPGSRDVLVLDTYDIGKNWNERNWFDWYYIKRECLNYEDNEIDPYHCAGMMANRIMKRYGAHQVFEHLDSYSYAHIVVGPDVEKAWQEKNTEDKPFPEKDFGGVLLSENAEFDSISSKDTWCNTPERWKLMFSREPTIVRHFDKDEDVRGFNTGKEDAPWVQFKLDSVRKITGMQIDVYRGTWYACPFVVWMSTDGKQWHEIHEELQERSRYRIDLNRKNAKAKFIRIGRKPGFRNEHFSLHKILIYGE